MVAGLLGLVMFPSHLFTDDSDVFNDHIGIAANILADTGAGSSGLTLGLSECISSVAGASGVVRP